MKRQKTRLALTLAFVGLIFSLGACSTTAQQSLFLATPTPIPTPFPMSRGALIQTVRERAQEDAAAGRQQETALGLEVLFGDQAAQVGMELDDIVSLYTEAYKTGIPEKLWWEPLLPNTGWIVAAIMLVVAALGGGLKKEVAKWPSQAVAAIRNSRGGRIALTYAFTTGHFVKRQGF